MTHTVRRSGGLPAPTAIACGKQSNRRGDAAAAPALWGRKKEVLEVAKDDWRASREAAPPVVGWGAARRGRGAPQRPPAAMTVDAANWWIGAIGSPGLPRMAGGVPKVKTRSALWAWLR